MSSQIYQRVRENPKFKELVTRRGRLGGLLSLIVLGCYYVFMAVVAFKPDVFRIPLAEGGMLTGEPMPQQQTSTQRSISPKDDEAAKFTSVILATTEDTWGPIFEKMGRQYPQPKLVLYRGATQTGCGQGQSVMGPFYCPADSTVYIDLSFYQDMRDKLGADGDFAQGYVVAHEVGHHVQHLLGISTKVRQQQQGLSQAAQNKLSVKLELQADCFAGVWGYHMEREQVLEHGDLEEALNAAQAIGDDRLQQRGQGRVVPDSFTHGSSAQRLAWFKKGFDSGKPASCDTFTAR